MSSEAGSTPVWWLQGKGVDVSFSADAVRPAGPTRQGRRSSEGEAA